MSQPALSFPHRTSGRSYTPEENPFSTILVDITHRCNMECSNCYIPNREIGDMDSDWLYGILKRLPRRARIRLVGAEPTVRKDLADIIRSVRRLGHLPVILSNGLKLANPDYVFKLKQAGLRTLHMSMNGGLVDAYYEKIDGMPCAERKRQALDALCAANMHVTIGMIVATGVNETHVAEFYRFLRTKKQVTEFHLRNVGKMGRYMAGESLNMDDLIDLACAMTGMARSFLLKKRRDSENYLDFNHEGMNIQLTEWPDMGNPYRGRLTPEGRLEPFFEHAIANEGGY
ncbi:MAG: radical SAM protein [Gammaproteobacteria bacterium]